jgi:probable H4MPT-linked C1 transfer pathway protein
MIAQPVIALDIGGANTKLASLGSARSDVTEIRVASHVFPVWQRAADLPGFLASLCADVSPAIVGVTTTAELADVFATKREGVLHVLRSVQQAFPHAEVKVQTVNSELVNADDALADPLACAAANWAASAWAAAQLCAEGVLGDTGSTTTDLIPFRDGQVEAIGKSDPERLASGELVYTGCLRTPCSHVAASVPWRGRWCRVSPEYFTIMGDVYRLLDCLSGEDYDWPTPDGRGTSKDECAARLARLICADLEIINESEVMALARFLHSKQLDQIVAALVQVTSPERKQGPLLCAGSGSFLLEAAAQRVDVQAVRLADLCGEEQARVFPAWSLCMQLLEKQRGGEVFDVFKVAH